MFLERFFHTSQFKRSAIPNAPKVGSGGSLSPRGDWRAPSDGNAAAWLAELRDACRRSVVRSNDGAAHDTMEQMSDAAGDRRRS